LITAGRKLDTIRSVTRVSAANPAERKKRDQRQQFKMMVVAIGQKGMRPPTEEVKGN
jgi:hypothetical protein